MSAYLVDHGHINYLVNAAMSRRLIQTGGFSWVWDINHDQSADGDDYERDSLEQSDYDQANKVGDMLWEQNALSVEYRYTEPIERRAYEFKTLSHYVEIDPVQVLKACDCYDYQSCEHPCWNDSQAKGFIDALKHAAIQALDGYDDAAWAHPMNRQSRN